LIDPAGEMWSVVTESPSATSTWAPSTSETVPGSVDIPSKYGGCRTYVESGSHANSSDSGAGSAFHSSSPSNTLAYVRANMSPWIAVASVSWISVLDGQTSRRKTGPSAPSPSGSVSTSKSIRPASAYATTSGGEAR
jgi:hypothetical protein